MKRVHCIISGDIVGVGYRTWVVRLAHAFRVMGWVKNREDRTVELVAEGEKEALEKLVVACKKGPDVAWVSHVEITWDRATREFMDFAVVY
ncbi:MAG: acylphosphatase [Candidatus Gottesmanbacteria bacterium]|nr:acylphosphatase [Candidatus Gottesmanbacteria bacterium]